MSLKKNVFSDCYLKTEDNKIKKVIRNYLSPLELELFNTEPEKQEQLKEFLKKFQRFFKNSKETIKSYVRLKHEKDNHFYFNNN